MSDAPTPTAAAVMGANVRRLRAEYTAEQLARECTVWGLRWGTGRIAQLEAGAVSATVPTVHRLCLALSDLLGRSVAPTELFDGDLWLQSVVSNRAVRRPRPAGADAARGWFTSIQNTWPERLQRQPYGRFHKTRAAMVEADTRIGKSLGLDADRAAAEMAYLWGKPLSVERDKRAGPDANKQQRGQITRALKDELRKVVADGDD